MMWSKVEVVFRAAQAKFFLRKLMSPLVEESWEWTSAASFSSGSIFFASCLPSSTLMRQKADKERDGGSITVDAWNHSVITCSRCFLNAYFTVTRCLWTSSVHFYIFSLIYSRVTKSQSCFFHTNDTLSRSKKLNLWKMNTQTCGVHVSSSILTSDPTARYPK